MQGAQTFRVRSVARLLVPATAVCAVVVAILFLVTEAEARWAVLIVGGVLVVGLGIGAWITTRVRLVITPETITYHGMGYRVRAGWADLVGHGRRVMGIQDVESLIRRGSGLEMSGWMALTYRLMPAISVASVASNGPVPGGQQVPEDAIPVGMFDRGWRTGEIGALVRRYAPEAFDTPV
ncbi:MAG: hypothetical protein KF809_06485 [Chloroflexi bacterium]|nr:hypothetical protein [Chloroflexota bacterium]